MVLNYFVTPAVPYYSGYLGLKGKQFQGHIHVVLSCQYPDKSILSKLALTVVVTV